MPDDEPRLAEEEAEEGAPDWVVTFGDLMSLLLTFFVLLLSFSQMDVAKFKELAGSLQQAFGVQRKIPVYEPPKGIKIVARDFDQAYVEQAMVGNIEPHRLPQIVAERLRHLLKPLLEQQLVELEVQEDYVIMRLLGDVTFASGSAALQPEVKPVLRAIGSILGTLEQEIIVAGHTDNVPLRGGAFPLQPGAFPGACRGGGQLLPQRGPHPPRQAGHHGLWRIPPPGAQRLSGTPPPQPPGGNHPGLDLPVPPRSPGRPGGRRPTGSAVEPARLAR
ncbi:MAG: hypothetical protein KatS3mg131_1249 [Candidatus Tectimicrobiota bacterium]|nr:MAG: hypothetical protein KatS3mg131_1249 [Candidatus Tectomicrobia bacterium]